MKCAFGAPQKIFQEKSERFSLNLRKWSKCITFFKTTLIPQSLPVDMQQALLSNHLRNFANFRTTFHSVSDIDLKLLVSEELISSDFCFVHIDCSIDCSIEKISPKVGKSFARRSKSMKLSKFY